MVESNYRFGDLYAPSLHMHAGYSRKSAMSWLPNGRELGCHGILLLVSGTGRYWDANGHDEPVTAGAVFLLFPGLRHAYGPEPGGQWREAFCDVRGGILPQLEDQGLLDRRAPILRPPLADQQPLRRLIDAIGDGRLRDAHEAQWRLHGALLAVLSHRQGVHDQRLDDLRLLLEQTDVAEPVDVRAWARGAGLSFETCRKYFRQRYGMGPESYRQRARLRQVAVRLMDWPGTLEDLAADCGYHDAAHLGRHFRRINGMSPGAFRRLHGG